MLKAVHFSVYSTLKNYFLHHTVHSVQRFLPIILRGSNNPHCVIYSYMPPST